ncbi:MAG: chromosomal replication initiator DnaA [Parvibaculaceae bacterium]|nr:chromosomal replication initiator DnaA [Parvibaculaceae bacterium]
MLLEKMTIRDDGERFGHLSKVTTSPPKNIDWENIARVSRTAEAIARVFDISIAELMALTRRRANVAFARQNAMYLCHVAFGMSFADIGRHFGRDRTTVSHACRLIEDARDLDSLDVMLDRLEFSLKAELEIGDIFRRPTH